MNEKELDQKRKEFRDTEIQSRIESYGTSNAQEYRKSALKSNYTYKKVDKTLSKLAWVIIISQFVGITFFSSLYVISYVPKTKFLVAKVMP